MLTYRHQPNTCTLCPSVSILSTCDRCQSPLCIAHMPANDQRCELCEVDWLAQVPATRPVRRLPLLVATVSWCALAFLLANAWTLAGVLRWLTIAVGVLSVGFLAVTQAKVLKVAYRRRRFLAERIAGPRDRELTHDTPGPSGALSPTRRRATSAGSPRSRWKLQTLCR